MKFTKVMDEYGEAHLVHDQEDLFKKLDAVIADPSIYASTYRKSGADQASDNLEAAIVAMMPAKTIDPRRFVRRASQIAMGIVGPKLRK